MIVIPSHCYGLSGGRLIMSRWPVCWMPVLLSAGCSILLGSPQQQSKALPAPAVSPERAIVTQYCVGCHNSKVKAAGLALDTVVADSVNQHTEAWEKVVRKL